MPTVEVIGVVAVVLLWEIRRILLGLAKQHSSRQEQLARLIDQMATIQHYLSNISREAVAAERIRRDSTDA